MTEKKAMRDAYGEALIALGNSDADVVVLDADLSGSTRTAMFAKVFPNRFFNMGIAEQDMAGTAAGFSCVGKKPFMSSFAMFATGRAWEPIRNSICLPNLNVKVVCTHAGITVGEDGACHQALEDISIMRVIPHMSVYVPADYYEARALIIALNDKPGPVYVRLARAGSPVVFDENYQFNFAEYPVLQSGSDVSLFACGQMVPIAQKAAQTLQAAGISVDLININTIKPLHGDQILKSVIKTGAVVTAEEHSILGGMGSAVSELLAKNAPTPIEFVGTQDVFGESGDGDLLMVKYGLSEARIVEAAQKAIARKANRPS